MIDRISHGLTIGGLGRAETARAVGEMLERVSLTAGYAHRNPDQLSGGSAGSFDHMCVRRLLGEGVPDEVARDAQAAVVRR